VVATDYPEKDILDNIEENFRRNLPDEMLQRSIAVAKGHLWGKEPEALLALLSKKPANGFDFIILSDLLFNHSQHSSMLKTCQTCLHPQGKVLVAFSHHRPRYERQDMEFFRAAQEAPFTFKVTKLFEEKLALMFPEDPGPEDVRATVHFYVLQL